MNRIQIIHADAYLNEIEHLIDATIYIEDDKVVSINQSLNWDESSYEVIDANHNLVFPGLIDVHIHGSMGKDFIHGKQESITATSYDVIQDGVTAYLSSLTVISHFQLCEVLSNLSKCESPKDGAKFLGIHSEGPFISKEFKALMNETHIRPYSKEEFQDMIDASNGKLKTVTFTSSDPNAKEMIKQGVKNDIVMMIGHTNGTSQETIQALKDGASGYTHFYNAMSEHHHRKVGTVTAGYTSNLGYMELIVDGFHVHPTMVKFTYDLIGSHRLILVTDAMPGKSMPDGEFIFSDLLSLKKEGKAYVKETGRIAGSVIGLNEALRNMVEYCNVNNNQLVEMACVNPARLLKIDNDMGSIKVNKMADIVIFDRNYETLYTIVNGKVVYKKNILSI